MSYVDVLQEISFFNLSFLCFNFLPEMIVISLHPTSKSVSESKFTVESQRLNLLGVKIEKLQKLQKKLKDKLCK